MDAIIRLSKTDSVNSVNKLNTLDVDLKNTSKAILQTNFRGNVDLFELFKTERDSCNNYRLIFAINPYCTNVLFNPFTEIVKDEGTNNTKAYLYNNTLEADKNRRFRMLADTKYSNEDFGGYVYHCGYDIFDNHILRNTSFKVVNDSANNTSVEFNTLEDKLRKCNGDVVKFYQRTEGLKKAPKEVDKHLYNSKDVLTFENSVAMNLREENGWFGFTNITNLKCLSDKEKDISKWACVINNRKSGSLIQMYPDSSLYSFTPIYNPHRNRLEYNWEYVLTYPFENDTTNELVYDNTNNISTLLVMSTVMKTGTSEEEIVVFRTYTKHNLERNDEFQLYYRFIPSEYTKNKRNECPVNGCNGHLHLSNEDGYLHCDTCDWIQINPNIEDEQKFVALETTLVVRSLGNVSGDNDEEHCFYINKSDLPEDFAEQLSVIAYGVGPETKKSGVYKFRIRKVTNGIPSKYYVRKLRPIPNFKARQRIATADDIKDLASFKKYEKENATSYGFDKEVYNAGFANTVYGDNITMVTFTDTINTELLKDNLGRPVTEIFLTLIKTNYGNSEWYSGHPENENVEYSHCFGDVNNGFVLSHRKTDKFHLQNEVDDDTLRLERRRKYKDIKTIYPEVLGSSNFDKPVSMRVEGENYNDKVFYCDVVEFIPSEFKEVSLSDVNYRFNSYQRDNIKQNEVFIAHELEKDDYSRSFSLIENERVFSSARKEGYYYKPHNKVQLRNFGSVRQGFHKDIPILTAVPKQENNIFISITTSSASNVNLNDIILLCDDNNQINFEFRVGYIVNRGCFWMYPADGWVDFAEKTFQIYNKKITWVSLCGYLNDGQFTVRRKNMDIPDYACRIEANVYLWRDVQKFEDLEDNDTTGYTYTNNAIYITTPINFYLKRQDPDGSTDLLMKQDDPSDILGKENKQKIEQDIYVVEDEMQC